MRLSGIFSKRNVMLFVFILVVLFLGTAFNVKIGHESFVEVAALTDNNPKPKAADNSQVGGKQKN